MTSGAATNRKGEIADPYLADHFHPLALASDEILLALRADESAPDADLYRRLISSSDTSSHHYHIVSGDGSGSVLNQSSNGTPSDSNSPETNGGESTGEQYRHSPHNTGSPFYTGAQRGKQYDGNPTGSSVAAGDLTPKTTTLPAVSSPPAATLKYVQSVPLPSYLADKANKAKITSLMGLLPEANLTWLTADDKLFLWSHNAGVGKGLVSTPLSSWGSPAPSRAKDHEGFCSFTVPSGQCIMTVGIVRPKKGIFKESIKWCVVVATPEEAILCALVKERPTDYSGDDFLHHENDTILRLVPTCFTLPTDFVPLISICGSIDGRIFMGGYDGCVYEMTYEGNGLSNSLVSTTNSSESGQMEAAIDDYFDGSGVFHLPPSLSGSSSGKHWSGQVLSGGKRVLSALTFGSLDDSGERRGRKCRKINHSSTAPGLASYMVPASLIRAASGIFGSNVAAAAEKGGPIVSLVLDEERCCLYTLGKNGVICCYDMSPSSDDASGVDRPPSQSNYEPVPPSPLRLASVFDAVSSAKLYLESVSRSRMYPPSTSHAVELGVITFPGGIASANAGVGGMEGARDILKKHDQESRPASSSLGRWSPRPSPRSSKNNATGVLHPVSIHLVTQGESKSLTLVAITGGGLRYYLSSLSTSYINSVQAGQGGVDYSARPRTPGLGCMRPGSKMTFCHIRAPPPYTSGDRNDGFRFELAPSAVNMFGSGISGSGIPPGIHVRDSGIGNGANTGGDVVKSYYGKGLFVLSLDVEKGSSNDKDRARNRFPGDFFSVVSKGQKLTPAVGDAIVVTLPDLATRSVDQPTTSNASPLGTNLGGISESIILPMTNVGGSRSPVLPGGRTFDIMARSENQSSVHYLFTNSVTPTDAELQKGLLPVFNPPKNLRRKPKRAAEPSSSSIVVSTSRGKGVISSALAALSGYLRSGQGLSDQANTVLDGSNGFSPTITYRLSTRYGCDFLGFSSSAAEIVTVSKDSPQYKNYETKFHAKSSRLPAWLLRPSAAPLNNHASQHLEPYRSASILVLNAGGLHVFSNSSVLNNFVSVLLQSYSVAKDDFVKNFFISYGYAEGCAMCFALATSDSSNTALRDKAEKAALCHARVPSMELVSSFSDDRLAPLSSYKFQPSSLYQGLVKFLSRLIRPFWYKPAVVVTEGRPIQSKSAYAYYYASLPAKIELLLDDSTLDDIRRPLVSLQNLMKKIFVPAVHSVPPISDINASDAMDIDEEGNMGSLITRAMQRQARASQRINNSTQTQIATAKELETKAFRTEERNMHSIYRLLSRCVQILNLLFCLKQTHSNPVLPEVQWGLVHGLTFHQLTTSREGQQRLETLLNALVSQCDRSDVMGLSSDGDRLADTLSRQCYLFFSSSSRLTYLGFRSANDALAKPLSSPQRVILTNQAASLLRAASRYWRAPALVVGRISSGESARKWEDVAACAIDAGSPLALAANILMELKNMGGLADVCLTCASNFGGAKASRGDQKEYREDHIEEMFDWEKGLYHQPLTEIVGNNLESSPSVNQAIITGIDVTASDALRVCHGTLFHYVSKLLGQADAESHRMAKDLVAACASSSDMNFLHSLYEHLLKTSQVDTLLRIDSSSLEHWLLREKKDVHLLWRYYSYHDQDALAGDVIWQKACKLDEKIPIGQRIEFLVHAANSFTAAFQSNHSSNAMNILLTENFGQSRNNISQNQQQVSKEELKARIIQVNEQLDIAKLQNQVLATVKQSENINLDSSKMDSLSFSLLNVSDLYNDFTGPLNLFDICLLIFETCRHNEADKIETLWRSIFCDEILPCQTNSEDVFQFLSSLKEGSMLKDEIILFGEDTGASLPIFESGDWIPRLGARVTSLGRQLYGRGADFTFPLACIVRNLEAVRQVYDKLQPDHESSPWVAQAVIEVGVPFHALLELYDALQVEDTHVGGGIDIVARLQLLRNVSELLEFWVSVALSIRGVSTSRVKLTSNSQVDDASKQLALAIHSGGLMSRIDAYKSSLEGFFEVDRSSVAVYSCLSNIEEVIRRNFF